LNERDDDKQDHCKDTDDEGAEDDVPYLGDSAVVLTDSVVRVAEGKGDDKKRNHDGRGADQYLAVDSHVVLLVAVGGLSNSAAQPRTGA
jgi:hypothetical protein